VQLLGSEVPSDDPRWQSLRYIVIDELDEGIVGLVVGPWPRVDERGRLRFGEEELSSRIAARAEALLAILQERRIVPIEADGDVAELLRARRLTVGDVFGAAVTWLPGEGGGGGYVDPPDDPDDWPDVPVLDVTAQARDATKAQASATSSGVIDKEFLDLVAEEFREDEGEEPPRGPTGSGENPIKPQGSTPGELKRAAESEGPEGDEADETLEDALHKPRQSKAGDSHEPLREREVGA
jgi:hypothetical protein